MLAVRRAVQYSRRGDSGYYSVLNYDKLPSGLGLYLHIHIWLLHSAYAAADAISCGEPDAVAHFFSFSAPVVHSKPLPHRSADHAAFGSSFASPVVQAQCPAHATPVVFPLCAAHIFSLCSAYTAAYIGSLGVANETAFKPADSGSDDENRCADSFSHPGAHGSECQPHGPADLRSFLFANIRPQCSAFSQTLVFAKRAAHE